MLRRSKKKFIYFLILVLPLVILFSSQSIFSGAKTKIVEISSLPIRIATFPFKEVKKILFYRKNFNELQSLRKEVGTLKHRLIESEEVLKENARFKNLLDFKGSSVFSAVAANIIGRDPSSWNSTIIIDRGSRDKISEGMPVASPSGVVGKVFEVGDKTSKVMLLSDPRFSVAALIQHSREQGLISGTLQGICRMQYLSPRTLVNVNDKVITSKLSSFFPEGFLIGQVIEVKDSSGSPTIECLVEPAVSLSQIEEVIVIRMPQE